MNPLERPGDEGVFGPAVVLNSRSGEGCLWSQDGVVVGRMPSPPLTNAFVVWLGWPAIVVSEGVPPAALAVVARGLRELLETPGAPVLISLGKLPTGDGSRMLSDNPAGRPARDLARAEAYVAVQCGWFEGDAMTVDLDGERFELRLVQGQSGLRWV